MSRSHQWVQCGCGRQGYLGEMRLHLHRCWGGRNAYSYTDRRHRFGLGFAGPGHGLGYRGSFTGPETQVEHYEPGEEAYVCRNCGHVGPGHRHNGVCPDLIRLEPHVQRLINHGREGGGYGHGRRWRRRSFDDLYAQPYHRNLDGNEERLAGAVEGLADAVDPDEDRAYRHHGHHDRYRHRHHHHYPRRHRHSHHYHVYHHHRPQRYGRARSVDYDNDGYYSDDSYDSLPRRHRPYRHHHGYGSSRRRNAEVVDDLADALGRVQLLDALGERGRGNRRLMRDIIHNR